MSSCEVPFRFGALALVDNRFQYRCHGWQVCQFQIVSTEGVTSKSCAQIVPTICFLDAFGLCGNT